MFYLWKIPKKWFCTYVVSLSFKSHLVSVSHVQLHFCMCLTNSPPLPTSHTQTLKEMHRVLDYFIEGGTWLSFPDNKVLINLVSAFPGGRELSKLEWGLLNLRLLKENVCCCAGQCSPPEQAVSILGPALSRCSGPSGVRSCISLYQQILPAAPTFPMAQRNQSQEAWLQWLSKGQALQASKSERYCQSVGFVIPIELHRK